ncbi:TPA: hypothetical protein U1U91_000243 [Streptococcus suis]|nr:hypothetical protein [Streptococcus suis]
MARLIASNQLTLTNVNDGRTAIVHWAYSDNADGTGLTTSDNGQRYIGHYSDYTQADSTDKTKYTWADRWAKIEVGGKNILRNSAFGNVVDSTERFTVGGVTYVNRTMPYWQNFYNGGIPNPTTSYHAIYRESFEGKGQVIEFNESDGLRNWKGISNTLRASDLSFGNYTFSADIYATGTGTKIWFGFYYYDLSGNRNFFSGTTTVVITTINAWHRVYGKIKLNADNIDLSRDIRFYIYAYGFTTNSILYLTKPQLEEGIIPTAYSEAQSDIDERIDTKADQALTLAQKRELEERMGLIESELAARALLAETDAWFNEYENYKRSLAEDKSESETKLTDLSGRIDAAVENLGKMSVRWNFLDTYMKPGNEGLMIGKIDGTTSIRVSDNRIAFYSGGKEVAFISNNTLEIENGIFTAQLQVGRFQTSQYGPNPDSNIVRYVGGK